jgi:hypothetical protein
MEKYMGIKVKTLFPFSHPTIDLMIYFDVPLP